MKTQLLYVLTSSETDYYLEQLYVSMLSAKYVMPDCHIIVIVDEVTKATLCGVRAHEIAIADEIITVNLNKALSAKIRSRLLKTSARSHVKGDFLFIDCDTIVVRDLSPIDEVDFNLGACRDTHSLFKDNPYREMCIRHVGRLGKDISDETEYYNSGVIFARDVPSVHRFYETWNANYLKGMKKGISMDQPSFEFTNIELNYPVRTLQDVWNCQLKHGIRYLKEAFIVHYLCTNVISGNKQPLFILNDASVFSAIKINGEIQEAVWDVIKDPFKGLSPITHCFGGKEIYFFQTPLFNYLFFNYLKSNKRIDFEKIFKIIVSIKNKLRTKSND